MKYVCERCNGVFTLMNNDEWNHQMALEEMKELWGPNTKEEDCIVVCHKCHVELMIMTFIDKAFSAIEG